MGEGESVWEMRGCFDFASYRYWWYSECGEMESEVGVRERERLPIARSEMHHHTRSQVE